MPVIMALEYHQSVIACERGKTHLLLASTVGFPRESMMYLPLTAVTADMLRKSTGRTTRAVVLDTEASMVEVYVVSANETEMVQEWTRRQAWIRTSSLITYGVVKLLSLIWRFHGTSTKGIGQIFSE